MEIDRRALLAALAGVAIIPLFEVADSKFRNLLSIPESTGAKVPPAHFFGFATSLTPPIVD